MDKDSRFQGAALVVMENEQDARNAIAKFNGFWFDGRELKCREFMIREMPDKGCSSSVMYVSSFLSTVSLVSIRIFWIHISDFCSFKRVSIILLVVIVRKEDEAVVARIVLDTMVWCFSVWILIFVLRSSRIPS